MLYASNKLELLGAVASWITAFLGWAPEPASTPSAVQLGLAQALLRAQVLEGYSHQLVSSSSMIAAHQQETGCSAVLSRFSEEHIEAGVSLAPRIGHTVQLLATLSALSGRCPPIRLTQREQALAAASAIGLAGTPASCAGVAGAEASGGAGGDAAGRYEGSNPDGEEWAGLAL